MKDPVKETEALARAYSVDFKDCGNGHIQLSGHGNLVNYYPLSKKRTLFSPTLNRRESHCSPWDAVRLCLAEAKKGMKPKKPTTNPAPVDLKPVTTNPAGLKHFYSGDVAPWDESLGDFQTNAESDERRMDAYQLEQEAVAIRAQADELDEADK